MVLSGIGGNTIAKAKESVSMQEFNSWIAYRKKRGSFNINRRIDVAIARLSAIYINSKVEPSKHCSIYDFLPYEDEPPTDLHSAMKSWE